ncbi:(d)CMP kinase [Archaeoglobus veneficus]|uniref:Cytidylate kinase n=1 Tax=Archaeoglobus veneficus (strain DSM 11195 / SNP6) TaxID=693661 RepID=F2KSS6_ARCVS|nr:AAA family ATPase [Archaeoglobus veneficus]AEA46971.1 Cytidylate kinase [Archaeoglobus veneficus SNP6]
MKITISGPPGSGTSTVAKIVASRLGFKLISAGEIFRQLARERGCTLEEFSKIADENEEIDIYIDRTQKEIAEKEDNIVVEGRLSGWMVEDALKVLIYADEETRFARIAKREKKSIEQVRHETRKREEYERRRYRKYYGIDIDDWSIYHLVINSACFSAETIAELILRAAEEFGC